MKYKHKVFTTSTWKLQASVSKNNTITVKDLQGDVLCVSGWTLCKKLLIYSQHYPQQEIFHPNNIMGTCFVAAHFASKEHIHKTKINSCRALVFLCDFAFTALVIAVF